jgi:hypothetical protein
MADGEVSIARGAHRLGDVAPVVKAVVQIEFPSRVRQVRSRVAEVSQEAEDDAGWRRRGSIAVVASCTDTE